MNEKEHNRAIAMRSLTISNVMSGLEGTIVATVIPSIVADLHGIQYMGWVITAYMLMMAVTAPIWTKLSQRFGSKSMFLTGTGLFVIASVLEGLSINMLMLILARVLMGIGAGAMMQLPFVIYGTQLRGFERVKATSRAIGAYSLAASIGPLLGGWLADTVGWRMVFFINLPIGAIMVFLVAKYFEEEFEPVKKPIDYLGSLTLAVSISTIMLAMQALGAVKVNMHMIIVLLIIALIMMAIFVLIEKRAADPVLPVNLFFNQAVMLKSGMMFFQYGVFGFFSNYLPMWGQGVMGTTALVGGLILLPSSILLALSSNYVYLLRRYLSDKAIVIIGLTLTILATILLSLLTKSSSIIELISIGGLWGLSTGIVNGIATPAVQEAVEPSLIGPATALNSLLRTLGTTLIVSILALLLNTSFTKSIQANHHLINMGELNRIVDANSAKMLPHDLLSILRETLFNGMHILAIASVICMVIAIIFTIMDPWKKYEE